MNSSISSSDAGRWRRFLATYLLAALLGGGTLAGAVCLIDPFDSGRFVAWAAGTPNAAPRLANASRARAPQFDSAIIGNSHVQLLAPEQLSALTGRRFVSLTIPGTGPLEQLAVARWFVARQGTRVGALVIGLDERWCQPAGELVPPNPFPFWLYAPDTGEYLAGLLKADTLRHAGSRLMQLAGLAPAARADGYDDYERGRVWRAEEVAARLAEPGPWSELPPGAADFPAAALLRGFLAELPPGTAVALAFPPKHVRALPPAGSTGARLLADCKAAFRAVAGGRAALLDLLTDGELARRDENFWDLSHYHGPVARILEDRIAEALPPARSVEARR